jgi:hypothetical protein
MNRERFPIEQMTYETARKLAVDFMGTKPVTHHGMVHWLNSWESYGSPDGTRVGLSQRVYFGDNADESYHGRRNEIVVYWTHDPEYRVFVFETFQLWAEITGDLPVQQGLAL